MSSGSSDPFGVRRLFTRFIVLVIVPVLGLVGFGIVAISNEREVVEKRFFDQYTVRLHTLAAHLASTLESASHRLDSADRAADSPLIRFDFTLDSAGKLTLTSSGPLDPALEGALAAGLQGSGLKFDGAATLLPVRSGPAQGLYAVREVDGVLRGVAFSERGLGESMAEASRTLFPEEPANFTLAGPRAPIEPAPNPMRRLLEELISERHAAGTVSLPLPGPLADWRIVATLPGGDPVRTALVRNRTIYAVALGLGYLIITVGVVLTLRGIWREVRLSRLKTDFVSNISHELRTPLTSIRMFAETLQQERATTPEERAACIEIIARESERLSQLTERTLDWARIEAGRRRYVRRPLDLGKLVQSVAGAFTARRAIASDALQITIAEGLPEVLADAGAIEQVLLNLLENAVKYTPGDERIEVHVRSARRRVAVDVIDHGIGIARREIGRVFDRFYRADDLLARGTEGTGLGLSIARRIVDAHDGRLSVKSRPGHGSTFTVELPAAPSPHPFFSRSSA